MAHITQFTIEGLAGRKEPYSIKLNRDVNVFYGLNGAGKTSLLRILESAMRRDASNLVNVPFTKAVVGIYSVDYDQIFTHSIEKRRSTDLAAPQSLEQEASTVSEELFRDYSIQQPGTAGARDRVPWHISPKLPGSPKQIGSWIHGWLPTSRLYFGQLRHPWHFPEDPQGPYSEGALDKFFSEAISSVWSTYSARLLSEVRRVQEAGLSNILQAVLVRPTERRRRRKKRLDAGTAYQRVVTFLSRQHAVGKLGGVEGFEKLYAKDPKIVAVVEHIDEVESAIEAATAPRARLESLVRRMFSGPKQLEFSDTSIKVKTTDGQEIGLVSLSSGEKHVLRIFAEVLNVGTSTLLIDEPEISLHIDWQRELIKSIQILGPNAQLVFATHSPEIMAEMDDAYIFRL